MRDIEVEIRCAAIRMDADEIAENSKDSEQLQYATDILRTALAAVETARQSLQMHEAA